MIDALLKSPILAIFVDGILLILLIQISKILTINKPPLLTFNIVKKSLDMSRYFRI